MYIIKIAAATKLLIQILYLRRCYHIVDEVNGIYKCFSMLYASIETAVEIATCKR